MTFSGTANHRRHVLQSSRRPPLVNSGTIAPPKQGPDIQSISLLCDLANDKTSIQVGHDET